MASLKNTAFKSALDFQTRQLTLSMEIIATQIALLNLVRSALPDEIAVHVQHCVHSGKRLLIYTEAASWASQIRFFHVAILNKVSTAGQINIQNVQVKISQQSVEQNLIRSARLPSMENIRQIHAQSAQQQQSDVLQQALSRLANTLERRKILNKN
ncbi:DciA family protein [Methylomonas sp. AM2-LC]|uniref:DciA family protein n=1 Tax=Methylomonas sp. AM2-LC TaxID=3153301 RepID=UPI0032653983